MILDSWQRQGRDGAAACSLQLSYCSVHLMQLQHALAMLRVQLATLFTFCSLSRLARHIASSRE